MAKDHRDLLEDDPQVVLLNALVYEPDRLNQLAIDKDLFQGQYQLAFQELEKKINEGDHLTLIATLIHYGIQVLYDAERTIIELFTCVNILKHEYLQRNYEKIVYEELDPSEIVNKTMELNTEFLKRYSNKSFEGFTKTLSKVYDEFEEQSEKKTIAKTGFQLIDEDAPFEEGKFVVLAARTSVGKSTMAQNIAYNFAKSGAKVLFVSLEMGARQLVSRLMSMHSQEELYEFTRIKRKVKDETGSKKQLANVFDKSAELEAVLKENLTIYYEQSLTSTQLIGMLRHNRSFQKFDLIIVDYIQLLKDETKRGQTNAQRVGDISRRLKILAVEQKACVLGVAQLNRTAASSGEVELHHIRDSGAIEQDANVVLLLDRELGSAATTLKLAKNREGKAGVSSTLHFNAKTCTFRDSSAVKEAFR